RGPEALQLAPGGVGAEVRDVQGGVAERGRVDVQQAGRCVRLPQDLLVVQVAVDEGRIGGGAESGEGAARGGDGPGAGRGRGGGDARVAVAPGAGHVAVGLRAV